MYSGSINKDLVVNYCYSYEYGPDAKYPSIRKSDSGSTIIINGYGLSISEGFNRNRLYISRNGWAPFVVLLEKTVKVISDNLYEIFPDINKTEFDIDSRVLERFQTEKACSTAGMTMIPAVWLGPAGECYPAIRINTIKGGTTVIPFEDCITLSSILSRTDPELYGLSLLKLMANFK